MSEYRLAPDRASRSTLAGWFLFPGSKVPAMADSAKFCLIIGLLSGCAVLQAGDEQRPGSQSGGLGDASHAFLQQHCLRCHGPAKSSGQFRLDQLGTDLSNPETYAAWEQVISRVRAAEMPPEKEPRPAAEQRDEFLSVVTARLEAESSREKRGRVILRRLNRVEYENTLNDLFAVRVSVRDMLPEDAVQQGFDNVGGALNVSPVFIERCLDAIDAVLDAAVAPVHREDSRTERYDLYESLPTWFLAGVWKQPEGVILFRNSGNSATDLRQFRASAAGRYRFRVAASAHNSSTPLPMAVLLGNFVVSGNPVRHLGYFDVPPGIRRCWNSKSVC